MRVSSFVGIAVLILSLLSSHAQAGFNDPISFSQAGTVTLTLNASTGGFDHILELAAATGPVVTPVMALTDSFAPSADVLGYTPANIPDAVALGDFAAGEEIVFRLTNVGSSRFGDPGVIDSQIFSGSASVNNPNPTNYFTYVDFIDPTTIFVFFEDVFGTSPTDPDPFNTFLSDFDVAFTLSLVVPEPATLGLVMIGFALIGHRRVRA